MSFKTRPRFSLAEARVAMARVHNTIPHLLDNEDQTYSIMLHSVCEHCDYCDERNALRASLSESFQNEPIHIAKSDPYAIQKIKMPENYAGND